MNKQQLTQLLDSVWRGATQGKFDAQSPEPSLEEGQNLQNIKQWFYPAG